MSVVCFPYRSSRSLLEHLNHHRVVICNTVHFPSVLLLVYRLASTVLAGLGWADLCLCVRAAIEPAGGVIGHENRGRV